MLIVFLTALAVEAHGRTIWIDEADQGTVFCVRLPHER